MLHWGLTYEQFNAQPVALVNRLFLLNQIKPFLPSSSWIQTGTIAAAVYNVNSSSKSKALNHEDIFPFLKREKTEVDLMEGYDEESQRELHAKIGAIFG